MPMDGSQLGLVLESICVVRTRHHSQDVALQDINPGRNDAQLVPQPQYRHAAPSGPWPWMDFSHVDVASSSNADTTVTTVVTDVVTNASTATEWSGYPQNLFGNWTPAQVERSQMLEKCSKNNKSKIYWMDVRDDWKFTTQIVREDGHNASAADTTSQAEFWKILQGKREANIRVRSLFVDHLTEPVLKMLGVKYIIEPFFFTSSINQIPSRYQEAISHGSGDHITITLPFVRTGRRSSAVPQSSQSRDNQINIQAPLTLSHGDVLFTDLLAIHMVRSVESNTIISYHPESTSLSSESAKRLYSLMRLVGDSVYWKNIFSKSKDPTFLFLAMLWYPLYAWDESLESLYNHVIVLESDVLTESRVEHTRDLHTLQAYLLHYESLLHSFQLSVSFIKKNPNPAMECKVIYDEERSTSNELMQKECENLLSEIDRLEKRRKTLSKQLKNVIDLAFANVNIRESASMRQITYLTVIFLPASLIASVFGMNVMEINPGSLETIHRYVQVTIALTAFTFYIVVALQTHTSFHQKGANLPRRLAWPILPLWVAVNGIWRAVGENAKIPRPVRNT